MISTDKITNYFWHHYLNKEQLKKTQNNNTKELLYQR